MLKGSLFGKFCTVYAQVKVVNKSLQEEIEQCCCVFVSFITVISL